jgi:murein DD-endopeptidase MepM/ murein hydrolase activator NlpD
VTLRFDTSKGRITQRFLQNNVSIYKERGLSGHTGVDWTNGFGKPVKADNAGQVYKVFYGKDRASNWQAVYMLCSYGHNKYMEICYGHLSEILVKEGDYVKAGQVIGLEGNFGDVFHNGVRITPEQQRAGDTRGSHVHESWRPVRIVSSSTSYCLEDSRGRTYKTEEGLYEIINRDEGTRGMIDPMLFSEDKVIGLMEKTIVLLKQLLALKKK